MSRMLKSSGAMGAATLTSRVLGMVREIVYARFMGDTAVAGAFTLAFMIPNLFRRLLGEGALTAAFIPLFKEKEKTAGEAEMWRAANAVISGLIVAAALIVGAVLLGVSVALATVSFQPETRLMLELLRWMFPYMLLVCLAAVFMGMLNARGHFFIPAMGATMLNVVMIAAVLLLAPRLGATLEQQIFALAIGVLVAGVAQAAFQWPTLRREGFRWRWETPWGNDTVRAVVERMVPGTIGVAALQINVLVTQGVAFAVDPSIVASFNYAVRLMELPQGVFGISLATFLLPTLSGLFAEKKQGEFNSTVDRGLAHLLFFNLPVTLWLIVLAGPIVRLLFERGEFTADSTGRAAFALQCLAPGLVAFSAVNILARAFFAMGDTRTPMRISLACLAVNLALALLLIHPLRQGGMGLANSLSAWLNALWLVVALRRKAGGLELAEVRRCAVPVLLASVAGGMTAWLAAWWWAGNIGAASLTGQLGGVFVPLGGGAAVFFVVAWAGKVATARELTKLWGRTKR
jgi:putative peptidoglycan lipid II flippase